MTLLFDIAPWIEPATLEATGADLYRRFELEPDTLAVAVVDAAGRPVGLVERNAFLIRMAAQYGRALWSGRPISHCMNAQPLIVDGDTTVAEFCGRILTDSAGELMHGFIVTCGGRYAGVGTMLGLLQAAARLADASSRQAQEALEARSRFLAVMSHEIRTPLNGVLAVAEIARRKCAQDELTPLLETISESGSVLLRLLNDALDVSRAEASALDLREEPLKVATLADDLRRLWSPKAEQKNVRFQVVLDDGQDLWALGDVDRLQQILNNLVSNALKFAGSGGVDVGLQAVDQGEFVWFRASVADDGPGVPQAELERIFEPFQQTEDGARVGGAGLGLTVCRQLVERMGGTIMARNRPEGGACFSFEVPLFAVPAQVAVAPAQQAGPGRQAHVLVADDNPTNRLIAQSLCEMFGCTVECVEDGAQAVEAAASGRFDIVLMDIKMPRMDGVEATRRIRSGGGPAAATPIIALTANADPADAAAYRRVGMNGVVEKPIKAETLLRAMTAVLDIEAPVAESLVA